MAQLGSNRLFSDLPLPPPPVIETTDRFFINESFTISQTASLYASNLPLPTLDEYDYILDINVTDGSWSGMGDLFSEKRFMTETNGEDDFTNYNTVHLNVNRSRLADLLETAIGVSITSNKTEVASRTAVYGTLDTSAKQLAGFRFLEIVATKVFGNAKTKIAIENNEDYYVNNYDDDDYAASNSLIGQIAWGIFNSANSKRNDVFNQYVLTDRIEDNANDATLTDVEGYPRLFMDFNFSDTVWEFPIMFYTDLESTGDTIMEELNNGPNVGGARLANGVVNVPILLRFSA